ncbi:MAG: tripartite tricarboxylate transporter substrate-binding protein [Alphaproteobacteria bacterium]|nr:tripartite tricarboxylate transporter substrate-binding protein [Alphaproteobacteria bacterium]
MLEKALGRASVAAMICSLAAGAAQAQSAEKFYKSKNVNLIVGAGSGGNYGLAARLLARHLDRHIPGKPTIVVRNMPGAGSVKAASHVYSVAPQDGSVICNVLNTLPLAQLFGLIKTDLDVRKLQWIGNPSRETFIMVVKANAPATTYKDMLKTQVVMGATAPTSLAWMYPKVMNEFLGTKFKVIPGYKSFAGIDLAMAQGEVHGNAGSPWYGINGTGGYSPKIRDGVLKVAVQFGFQKAKDLGDVPLLSDLAKGKDEKVALELFSSPTQFGKPSAMGPKVPADRVAAIRKAYGATMKDAAYIADAGRLGIKVNPVTGDELAALAARVIDTPKTIVGRAKKAIAAEKKRK